MPNCEGCSRLSGVSLYTSTLRASRSRALRISRSIDRQYASRPRRSRSLRAYAGAAHARYASIPTNAPNNRHAIPFFSFLVTFAFFSVHALLYGEGRAQKGIAYDE